MARLSRQQHFSDRLGAWPIAEGGIKRTKQCSIVANGAEQKAYFGVSLLNNESTSFK